MEGTHEALVDAETFRTVQERVKVKQAGKKRSENNIFRGIMFCGECGKRMAFCSRKKDERRKSLGTFSCNANRRYGGKVCTTHYISLEQVKAIVLANIRRHAMLVAKDADAYADYLMSLSQTGHLSEQKAMKKELDAAQRRLSELATLVQRIYEDNVFGRLSDNPYQTLSAKYEAETKELKTRAAEIQALLTEAITKTQGIQDFTALVAPYANITELDEELVHTLIEKIIVHEKEIIDGETVMRIEIYYRFIGKTSDCLNHSVTPIKTKTESVAATDSIT